MDSTQAIYDGLKDAEIDFIVSVPCVNLSKLLNMIDDDQEITHIPVTREEEGIGICAGAYLGGKRTAILMQNSGLGNSINALKSLMELYEFPLLMIMSHGERKEKTSAARCRWASPPQGFLKEWTSASSLRPHPKRPMTT